MPKKKEQKEEPLVTSNTIEKTDEEPPEKEPPTVTPEKNNQGEAVLQAEQETTSLPDTQSAMNSSQSTNLAEQFTQAGLLIVTNPVYLKRGMPVYPRDVVKHRDRLLKTEYSCISKID